MPRAPASIARRAAYIQPSGRSVWPMRTILPVRSLPAKSSSPSPVPRSISSVAMPPFAVGCDHQARQDGAVSALTTSCWMGLMMLTTAPCGSHASGNGPSPATVSPSSG